MIGLDEIEMEFQKKVEPRKNTKYEVMISYHGETVSTEIQCIRTTSPDKKEVLTYLLSDMTAYDYYNDIDTFQKAFDYVKASECIKAFERCKATSQRMHNIFTEEELESITRIINNGE